MTFVYANIFHRHLKMIFFNIFLRRLFCASHDLAQYYERFGTIQIFERLKSVFVIVPGSHFDFNPDESTRFVQTGGLEKNTDSGNIQDFPGYQFLILDSGKEKRSMKEFKRDIDSFVISSFFYSQSTLPYFDLRLSNLKKVRNASTFSQF